MPCRPSSSSFVRSCNTGRWWMDCVWGRVPSVRLELKPNAPQQISVQRRVWSGRPLSQASVDVAGPGAPPLSISGAFVPSSTRLAQYGSALGFVLREEAAAWMRTSAHSKDARGSIRRQWRPARPAV